MSCESCCWLSLLSWFDPAEFSILLFSSFPAHCFLKSGLVIFLGTEGIYFRRKAQLSRPPARMVALVQVIEKLAAGEDRRISWTAKTRADFPLDCISDIHLIHHVSVHCPAGCVHRWLARWRRRAVADNCAACLLQAPKEGQEVCGQWCAIAGLQGR